MRQFMAQVSLAFDLATFVGLAVVMPSVGHMRVAFLFVISGFCIHGTHGLALRKSPDYRLNIEQFAWKRATRIYPPFVAALLLTAALDAISWQFDTSPGKYGDGSARAFAMNLLTLQNISAPAFGSNAALWALSIEMHFYVVYPLLFALRRRTGLFSSTAVILLISLLSMAITMPSGLTLFTNYLAVWWAGGVVAEKAKFMTHNLWSIAGLGLIAASAAVSDFHSLIAFQISGVGFALLLSGSLRMKALGWKVLGWLSRPFTVLGRFGYSIYLIHTPVLVLFGSAVYRNAKPTQIYPVLAAILIAIAVAYGFYLFIERGSFRFIRPLCIQPVAIAEGAQLGVGLSSVATSPRQTAA